MICVQCQDSVEMQVEITGVDVGVSGILCLTLIKVLVTKLYNNSTVVAMCPLSTL